MVAHREFFSCHPSPPRLHFTETTGLAIQFLPVEADWRPQRNVSPRVWRGCAAMHRSIKEAGAISDGLGFPPPQELSEFNPSRSDLATGFRLGVYLLQLLCCAVPNCRSIGKPGLAAEAATRIGPLPPEPPGILPNYGERYRNGERIATGFVESTVNQVVSQRMGKRQPMQGTDRGAHLLLSPPKSRGSGAAT